MRYNWYGLVTTLRTDLLVDGGESSVDAEAYNNIVLNLKWYNLKGQLQQLVDLINHSSTVLDTEVTWYNLLSDAESIYNNFN